MTQKYEPFSGYPTWKERPFDSRLSEVCIKRESDGTAPSVIVCIQNPDYVPLNQRKPGPIYNDIVPTDDYRAKTAAEYHGILVRAGVTKSSLGGAVTASGAKTDARAGASGSSDNTVGHAGLGAIPTAPKATTNFISVTEDEANRLIKFYGTDNWAKLKIIARKDLGIDNPKNIIDVETRKSNFDQFVKENFVDGNTTTINIWPTNFKTTVSYKHIETYANTEYGSLVIKRILIDNKSRSINDGFSNNGQMDIMKDRFEVQHLPKPPSAGYNRIMLPLKFPDGKVFFSGGEKIDPIGVIHHEFGHTRFFSGQSGKVIVTLKMERKAVIENSNPVRILNGFEPRYTYTHTDGLSTINILTGEEIKHPKGKGYTIKKDDPSAPLMRIGSKGALI